MKLKKLAPVTLCVFALAANTVSADEVSVHDVQSGVTFTSAAIAGGLVAGPVGAFFGALGAALISDHAKQSVVAKEELTEAEVAINELEQQMLDQEFQLAKLEKSVVKNLQFQVMFSTGEDELTAKDQQRIDILASYLRENRDLLVRLEGHTDPRGTDEYNNVLSEERALSVLRALEKRGIGKDRIVVSAYGSNQSIAGKGDVDAYSLERRVNIEIYSPENFDNMAAAN